MSHLSFRPFVPLWLLLLTSTTAATTYGGGFAAYESYLHVNLIFFFTVLSLAFLSRITSLRGHRKLTLFLKAIVGIAIFLHLLLALLDPLTFLLLLIEIAAIALIYGLLKEPKRSTHVDDQG